MLLEATNHSHQQFQATRLGFCEVPVPRRTVTWLLFTSQIDGFADTWLHWDTDRGDRIPEEYTLRLARAVQIGGQVVDAAGQPVAGASVSFGTRSGELGLSEARPEAHAAGWIEAAPTDSAGHWSLSRIAPEVFHRMEGAASHPEHLRTRVSVAGDPAAEKQLLAGTYAFRLGRAVTLRGVILDPESQPVPEAKLLVRSRPEAALTNVGVGILPATNQADGTFILTGCAPGNSELRVEATGFIPARVELNSETNPPPLRIILQRGKVLRLHVVDQKGAPVPSAEVEITHPGGRSLGQLGAPVPKAHAEISDPRTRLLTDAEGRVQWDGAAAEEVTFQVRARGYIRAENVTAKADGQEHLITLSPSLTISGTVRDAVTGRPVPHFRIIPGRQLVSLTHITNFQWQSVGRIPWTSSAEGKFRQTVAEAVDQDTRLALKFDAEGYAPSVRRVVRSDEGEVQFDVALRPAASVTVTVLLPDGNPAVNADVGLVSPGARLRVQPGGLARGNMYPTGESAPTTDDRGRFVLPPDDDVTAVIVASQNGYAEATRAALAAEPIIRLQPWGRIEGTFLSGGRGATGRAVQLLYGPDSVMHNTILADLFAYQEKTDNDGRFVFAQVPPGKHRVAPQLSSALGRGRGFRVLPRMSVAVEVRPGQTTTVTLGNSNYTVTARLRWPAELKRDPNWGVHLSLYSPIPDLPDELRNDPEALATWRAQPEIAAAYALRLAPPEFSEEADGTFVADNVPPGGYELIASASEMPATRGDEPKLRASARVPVTVPADPPTGTLDLGEIVLQPAN